MAKGIIVIDDIPVICAECDFATLKCNGKYIWCDAKREFCNNSKPNWCPIKPLPKRAYRENYCDGGRYDEGWNDCLDEIEGRC